MANSGNRRAKAIVPVVVRSVLVCVFLYGLDIRYRVAAKVSIWYEAAESQSLRVNGNLKPA